MKKASIPTNEADRLNSLRSLDVLDASPEAEIDAMVRMASLVCGVPIYVAKSGGRNRYAAARLD